MHFRHHFHPAGHGTFFSGHFGKGHNSRHDFVWVYDCGSKESSHLRGLVEDFHSELQATKLIPDQIDLLCISHFDSDHVNGLDLLFEKFRVKALVLPYVHLRTRLFLACEISEDETAEAAAVAAMTLDPVMYFQLREHGRRIERVILIRGRHPDAPDISEAGVPSPTPEDDLRVLLDGNELRRPVLENKTARSTVDEDNENTTNDLTKRITLHDDTKPITVDGVYEFVFYNKALPEGDAPKSGVTLEKVEKEAVEIIRKFQMASSKIAQRGWRTALKTLYEHHFGSTAKAKNEISLCVYGRSLLGSGMAPCNLYRQQNQTILASLKLTDEHKTGLLMTGDSTLKKKELMALQRHLGPDRWQRTGLMQIPHHGSEHNWQQGNSRFCKQDYSVICAPGSQYHPHKEVLKDVRTAILSNYGLGVAFDYHLA